MLIKHVVRISLLFQDSSFRGIRTTSTSQHQSGRLQQSTCPGWSSWFPKKPAQCHNMPRYATWRHVTSTCHYICTYLYTFVICFSPVTVEVTFVVTSRFVNRTSESISPFHIEVHEKVPMFTPWTRDVSMKTTSVESRHWGTSWCLGDPHNRLDSTLGSPEF